MKLPFSTEQFLELFRKYNLAVWPMQIIFYLLAAVVVFFAIKRKSFSDKLIVSILSFFWLWMGAVYHLAFFTSINKAAYLFGGMFIMQAILFLLFGIYNKGLPFQFTKGLYGTIGVILIIFSLAIYPVTGYLQGHIYPASPTFGLPCPTTIFTFGILLWNRKKISLLIILIPFLWSIIGSIAAFKLGIHEDSGLLVSGLTSFILLVIQQNKQQARI